MVVESSANRFAGKWDGMENHAFLARESHQCKIGTFSPIDGTHKIQKEFNSVESKAGNTATCPIYQCS